jgi:ankyrin repeat protein
VATVDWMLQKGVALNFRSDDGYTVLHSCIDRDLLGKYEILRLLIAAGADLDAKGINDWTPLHLAAARDDLTALKILLDAGADRTIKTEIDDYNTPAEEARMLGRHDAAKFIEDFE